MKISLCMRSGLFVLILLATVGIATNEAGSSHTILKLDKRDDEFARRIASDFGMIVKGKPFMESHYFVEPIDSKLHSRRKRWVLTRLEEHPAVNWVREDYPKKRVKRDYAEGEPTRVKRSTRVKRQWNNRTFIPSLPFPDPLYNDQWYLVGKAVGNYDMNVREAWLLGYSGVNVSISILDDGIQRDHPDLIQNFDPIASTDINDHDDDPTPQNNGDNKHGTRCAGEVAATAGNNVCGVGVAFRSKIGGVRMLDGPVSDSVEAASLTLRQDHIDIYSASWGPEDDGKTFDGPGALAQEAFYRGIKQGRNGKGNIFIWASGNGGSRQDSCSADGYTTSIYTLSISSATFDNRRPWYLEECPSTIATTYSSANINQPAIVTVDVPNDCTKMHTGTSASAPLAAGIIALALEANPALTWRDMQHVVLRTANPTPLLNNAGWSMNGVGRRISNKFGYGLMDAGALVRLAKVWKTVPPQHMCTYEYILERPNPRPIVGRFRMNFSLDVTGCSEGTPVLYLEHVQVVSTIRFGKRGDLKLTLYSPSGTEAVLLPPRPQDFNQNGFHRWPFLSVHTWGEDPRGTWTLVVESVTNHPNVSGMFSDWSLLLYGTAEPAQPSDARHPAQPAASRFRPNSHQVHQSFSSQTETPESINTVTEAAVNVVESVGNCHPECEGCSEPNSAAACFSCKHFTQTLRNRAGFKCVSHCDDGFFADGDKCKKCNSNCRTCVEAERCETCNGALLLIDSHVQRTDHGLCVAACPIGLRADYSRATQARCLLKANFCGDGYYEGLAGRCQICDDACRTCRGPGPLECIQCSGGYWNSSLGYCRPCCKEGEDNSEMSRNCEICSQQEAVSESPNGGIRIGTVLFSLLAAFIFIGCLWLCIRKLDSGTDAEYSPLRAEEGMKESMRLTESDESEDDEQLQSSTV